MSKDLLERKRHTKAELSERLESIALKSSFNQERNIGSDQAQICNIMNRNGNQLCNRKRRGKEEYVLSNTSGGISKQERNTKKGI